MDYLDKDSSAGKGREEDEAGKGNRGMAVDGTEGRLVGLHVYVYAYACPVKRFPFLTEAVEEVGGREEVVGEN